jgi:NAD(P)-dependent dehydrogenase (short-subunit alcohol dehydrogenase family)
MAKHVRWTQADAPDQTGKVVVVTGANAGIGLELAGMLALRGARVLFCCRDPQRGSAALDGMPREASSKCELIQLDLASLASVREASNRIRANHPHIHVLINNAGVMWHPQDKTADGFEVHLGVNHLGHFALTGLLMDRLLATENSRVVTLSGLAYAHCPRIQFDDLQLEHAYSPEAAYAQSKLANLLFAYRLQARLTRAATRTISLAAHPGAVQTDLLRHAALWMRVASALIGRLFSQAPAMGALPALRAATDPHARGGHFYGPDGAREFRGYPVEVLSNEASHDVEMQRRLWDESERLTGVHFPI